MEISELKAALVQEAAGAGEEPGGAGEPRRSPNAELQDRVILFLSREVVTSVSGLARDLQASRPSVSRAINTLQREGLAAKDGNHWSLTAAGKQEAERIQGQLRERAERVAASARRSLTQQVRLAQAVRLVPSLTPASQYSDLARKIVEPPGMAQLMKAVDAASQLSTALRSATAHARSIEPVRGIAFDNSALMGNRAAGSEAFLRSREQLDSLLGMSQKSMNAFLSSQLASVTAMRGVESLSAPLASQLSTANLGISRIIADLASINVQRPQAEAIAGMETLLSKIGGVARSYDDYFREALKHMRGFSAYSSHPRLWDVALPTWTTATLVSVATDTLRGGRDGSRAASTQHSNIALGEQAASIEDRLGSAHPRFVAMWRGAWFALDSSNPDRVRQAAHSGRELWMQILAHYAPDDAFTPEENKQHGNGGDITRKMRVKKILGSKSATDWVEAMTKATDEMYARLAAVSHDRTEQLGGSEEEAKAILMVLGGLLLYVIPSPD